MDDQAQPLLRTRRGLVFTALPAIAVVAALGAVLAYAHYRSSVDDRRAEARSLAVAAATNARRFVDDQFVTLATAAAAPAIRRGDVAAIRRYLPMVARSGRFTSGVGYIDADLVIQAFSRGLPGGRPSSVRDRAYARTALREDRPVISDVLIARKDGAPIVVFAYPVTAEDGGRGGVLTGSIRLDEIDAAVKRLLYAPGAGGTILDSADKVIVGERPVRGIQDPPSSLDVRAMRARDVGVLGDVDTPAGRRLMAFAAVPDIGWLVAIERSYADVIGPLNTALAAEVLALLLLATLGVLATFSAARRVDRIGAERDAALEEQRTIALRLQRSLLPDLPELATVSVDAQYAPAEGAMSVGGDWYDVVDLEDGRVALSVGDVAGHGLAAAAAMGQLRSAVRTLALGRHEPADALTRLDDFTAALDGRPLATVVYAILDPDTGRLRYACAGHPPPLLVRADGSTEFLQDGRSPLLGVEPIDLRPVGAVTLAPGDTLICYTDGLVERPDRSIDAGMADLVEQARAAAGRPGSIAAALLAGVAEPRRDDAAVLCVTLQPSRVPS